MTARIHLFALIATFAGCASNGDPAIDLVDPPIVSPSSATAITVRGRNFFDAVQATVDDTHPATFARAYQVRLGDRLLDEANTQRIDDHTITTVVPGGMAPGSYDLSVATPTGRVAIATAAVRVESPAQLVAAAAITPSPVAVGQTFSLTLVVTNLGEAPVLGVAPAALAPSGTAQASLIDSPMATDLGGGQSHTFAWTLRADVAGTLTYAASVTGQDDAGGPLAASASASTIVDTRPLLSATTSLPAGPISVGQGFSLTLVVSNAGQSVAHAVAPDVPTATGAGAATIGAPPSPADIPAGGQRTYAWSYVASAAGTLSLSAGASGTDAAGAPVQAPPASAGPLIIQAAPVLTASATATPATVSTGETITLGLQVSNGGGATAKAVTPTVPQLAGGGSATLVTSPSPADISAGQSATFTWTYTAGAPGAVRFTSSASGSDANSGMTVMAAPATSNDVQVQAAASLAAVVVAKPAQVSIGEQFNVDVSVTNTGGATATSVTTTLPMLSGPGLATLVAMPGTRDIPGGQSRTFTWTFKASGAGTTTLSSSASGTDANSGATASTGTVTSNTVTIQTSPQLTASLVASPATVSQAQTITVTLTIGNSGQASASIAPTIVLSGSSTPTLLTGPSPASATVPGGGMQSFVWTYRAGGIGTETFTASASGIDVNSGAAASSPTSSQGVTVSNGAALSVAITAPASVAAGASFTVTMTVTCVFGGNNCANISPSVLTIGGTTTATLLSGPTPASVPGNVSDGSSVTFTWTYQAGLAGTLTFSGSASGKDANTSAAIASNVATSNVVTVGNPALLTSALALPSQVTRGSTFTATLTVQNTGGNAANAVAPSSLSATGTGSAVAVSGPTPASASVAAGATVTFTWSCVANSDGSLILSGSASGTDAVTGKPVSTSFSSNTAAVVDVVQLFADPFGDGSFFLDVFAYAGFIYLGPRTNGQGAMRTLPDGSAPQMVTFSFPFDSVGHAMTNTSAAPFPSIGASGCTPNTSSCGPDNENGRGLFTAGIINGAPWLIVGGSKSTGTSYAYMTNDTTTAPTLPFVDLSNPATNNPFGLTAVHVFRNLPYLGFGSSSPGNGPVLVTLSTLPSAPGLNATSSDATNLKVVSSNLGGVGAIVDTIADFSDRLYVLNGHGCLVSTNNAPRPYPMFPADWSVCDPSTAATGGAPAVVTAKTSSIEPADRAYPAAVSFGALFYVARNTSSGPQLLVCNPARSGDLALCDPSDWTLVADNTQGTGGFTQFNDSGNVSIAFLGATSSHLYVGFNNPSGVQLYRSRVTTPLTSGDFEGFNGCDAGLHPASCGPLGGAGLGDPTHNQRIYSGVATTFNGQDDAYLVVGSSSVGARVFRVAE